MTVPSPFSPLTSTRRQAALLLIGLSAWLSACGGGSDDKPDPQIRVLNLSELSSVDLYLDGERKVSAAAQGQLGSYQTVAADSFDVELRRAGGDTQLARDERRFSDEQHFTVLVYGRESQLGFITLPEDEDVDDLDSGKAGLRVFNASLDVGDLDVYVTQIDADLSETVPTQASVGSGRLSGFRELSGGSYRVRVTGAGDSADLRLDLPAVKLDAASYTTLILTAGSGGVLVHGGTLRQQGGFAAARNTKARLRVVAGASGRGVVTASWQGRSISAGLVSPSVGPYALVDASDAALDVRVGGQVWSSGSRKLEAGADYTLLAHGQGGVNLIADDNRLPASSSRARVRLVHGAPLSDALTLAVDYSVVAADVATGQASSFANVVGGDEKRLDVSAASAADAIYTLTDTKLQNGALYTVFVLGGAAQATGLLRKDR